MLMGLWCDYNEYVPCYLIIYIVNQLVLLVRELGKLFLRMHFVILVEFLDRMPETYRHEMYHKK